MITENLSTLKINKLTQEQYNREFLAGNIDPNALYLTPDDNADIDLSGYATLEDLEEKSDVNHNHDSSYDTKGSADTALESAKSYTDTKIDALVGEGASETLDTIGEISAAIEENQDMLETLNSAIGNKANSSDLTSHTGNTSNPHSVTKSQVGLGNVENKSSATIRGEITKSNVTTALGYTPYTPTEVDTKLNAKVPTSRTINGKALTSNLVFRQEITQAAYNDLGNEKLTNGIAYHITDADAGSTGSSDIYVQNSVLYIP